MPGMDAEHIIVVCAVRNDGGLLPACWFAIEDADKSDAMLDEHPEWRGFLIRRNSPGVLA